MKIGKNIEIVDLALKVNDTLVIADTHIGYEEALNKQGILVPRFQFKDLIERVTKILEKTKPKIIVLNGDVKHEFGTISNQEWRETLKFLDLLSKYAEKIILVKGNHDTILGPIAKKRNIEIVVDYRIDDILIAHGDSIPKDLSKVRTIIIGHEHPAVSIGTRIRKETYKCFLVGKYKRKKLVVMPSSNLVVEGTDVLKEELLSPLLKQDLGKFNVYIIGDKVYDFGKLKNLR